MKKMVKKKKSKTSKQDSTKKSQYKPRTLNLTKETDIAMDFATKVYENFDKTIKSIILFGSSAKQIATKDSDIDIIIIIDDVSIKWDTELIAWYREELGKLIQLNPYKKSLHVNTVKLSTWWEDVKKGDPIVINILRYGQPLIDYGGFFSPLKVLLQQGKIKSTPEAVYTLLQRAPNHMARARVSLLGVVDGLYWACVDSAHAAIISANLDPVSPEHIGDILYSEFVDKKLLNKNIAKFYNEIHSLQKQIIHGKPTDLRGNQIDELIESTDEFLDKMAELVDKLIDK